MNEQEDLASVLPIEETIDCDCAIVGAGPAGLMLGLLLARAGVNVTVVEKHGDFLRDFRGDTLHPSTLEVMHELGLLEDLLKLPHVQAPTLHAEIGGRDVTMADFSRLPTRCRFIAFMPQWDFLDFLAREAGKYPNFRLLMNARVETLLEGADGVAGLTASTPQGLVTLRSRLVVGADGRHSVTRAKAGLEVESFGSPSDVLWFKLSHQPQDPPYTMGHGGPRQGFVMIDRGDYWQCGYIVRKGSFDTVKARGIEAFRQAVALVSPLSPERVQEVTSFDDLYLLSIRIDRLKRWWKPGLICIGDAAHAMSPIGGVGVNLAIQDAVAAANRLVKPLLSGEPLDAHLAAIEKRRLFPTKATQKLQLMMRRKPKAEDEAMANEAPAKPSGPPAFLKTIARWPLLAHIAGRLIGLGFRPEHVRPLK
ncbi:FAD-dependent oxidoreductase [Agrobacterium vitis]|uniref:FAD-dependent oxidoreductase n=1 Tax=Agrobacterium vitis TaxID=373 RepID=A0A6L6VE65_AGRVI|nr:FAD-dependent oxidoreductase [Agrobacterium vitis]MUZ74053.1 FAD-dependent oxidoreductase [Agrobacterium vitis]